MTRHDNAPAQPTLDAQALCAEGRRVIAEEAQAVAGLASKIGDGFVEACRLMLTVRGRVVVSGIGKSGHIARKIAATLASTGTPAFFVHPGEAGHGDLGMITADDLLMAVSNSGETPELLTILPILKNIGCRMITLAGKADSTLAQQADAFLHIAIEREACPNNLAPTSSTTATLVMGDALAVALQHQRGFSEQDFARTHPGGILGRRLLLYVRDLMHTGRALPLAAENASLQALILEMSAKKLGIVGVVDTDQRLIGIFTDGDLRRALADSVDIYRRPALDVINRTPVTVSPDWLAAEVVKLMRDHARLGPHALNSIFVLDEAQRVVGALNTHDLLRNGII